MPTLDLSRDSLELQPLQHQSKVHQWIGIPLCCCSDWLFYSLCLWCWCVTFTCIILNFYLLTDCIGLYPNPFVQFAFVYLLGNQYTTPKMYDWTLCGADPTNAPTPTTTIAAATTTTVGTTAASTGKLTTGTTGTAGTTGARNATTGLTTGGTTGAYVFFIVISIAYSLLCLVQPLLSQPWLLLLFNSLLVMHPALMQPHMRKS